MSIGLSVGQLVSLSVYQVVSWSGGQTSLILKKRGHTKAAALFSQLLLFTFLLERHRFFARVNKTKMTQKKLISLILSLIISAGLIWLLLSSIELNELWSTLQNIHYPALFIFMLFSLFASVLRAWRYKILLDPYSISWFNILLVTFIRNVFVDLLPARIGSLSYVYLINRRLNFPLPTAASTFILAFVFDFITLSPILLIAILAVGTSSSFISSPVLLFAVVLFFIFILLFLHYLTFFIDLGSNIFKKVLKLLNLDKKKWAGNGIEKLAEINQELIKIRRQRKYWSVFLLSLVLRLAKYGAIISLLWALLYSHGFSLPDLNFFKVVLGVTGAEFTSILPIKGIGGFGTWESAWAFTFQLLHFEQNLAIITGLGVHLISNFFEYIIGILSIILISLPFIKKSKDTL